MHRAAPDAVERAFVGIAVFLEPALEQDDDARFTACRRSEQQHQAASYFRAGARRAEVIGETLELFVDSEQVFAKQLVAGFAAGTLFNALPADHVPDVLVARPCDGPRIGGENLFDEVSESSRPVGGPVLLCKGDQTSYKVAVALTIFRTGRHICPPRKMLSPAVFKQRPGSRVSALSPAELFGQPFG